MKTCTKCKLLKLVNEFHKYSKGLYGVRSQCKSCLKEWRISKRLHIKNYGAQYRTQNRKQIVDKNKRYQKNKYNNDIQFKLSVNLRNRLYKALSKTIKAGSAVKDLGCSIKHLKQYLESQFKPGMSWNNHGKWHIDHVIPLKEFNLTDKQSLRKACHYTNLQPLWAKENLQKGGN